MNVVWGLVCVAHASLYTKWVLTQQFELHVYSDNGNVFVSQILIENARLEYTVSLPVSNTRMALMCLPLDILFFALGASVLYEGEVFLNDVKIIFTSTTCCIAKIWLLALIRAYCSWRHKINMDLVERRRLSALIDEEDAALNIISSTNQKLQRIETFDFVREIHSCSRSLLEYYERRRARIRKSISDIRKKQALVLVAILPIELVDLVYRCL